MADAEARPRDGGDDCGQTYTAGASESADFGSVWVGHDYPTLKKTFALPLIYAPLRLSLRGCALRACQLTF